jgi:WD40 repeat protein
MRGGAPLKAVAIILFASMAIASGDAAVPRAQAARPELVLQTGHGQGTLWHVALSADGQLLASGGRGDNAVHLWEIATGRQLRLFESEARGQKLNSGVTALAFGGGRRVLGAGFTDGSLAIWDVATGRPLGRFPARTMTPTPFPVGVTQVWFDAAGDRFFSAGAPEGVRVFQVTSGAEAAPIPGAPPPQFWLPQGIAADGQTIFSFDPAAKGGELVVLQDVASKRATRKRIPGSLAAGRAAVSTADGRVLVASVADDALQITDVVKGGDARVLRIPGEKVQANAFVALSADGRAAVASGRILTLWAPTGSVPVYNKPLDLPAPFPDAAAITSFEFSADGRALAVGTVGGIAVVMDSTSGRETARLSGGVNVPYSVAFDASGRHLYAGERTSWNFESGRGEKLVGGAGAYLSAFSANGRVLALAAPDRPDVTVWDVAAKRPTATLSPSGPSAVGHVALSADGRLAAVSYTWSRAQIDRYLRTVPTSSAASPAAGVVSPLRIWDVATGREVRSITAEVGAASQPDTLQFSPDGRQLAVTFLLQPGPLIFEVASGRQLAALAPASTVPAPDITRFFGGAGGKNKNKNKKVDPRMVQQIEALMAMRSTLAQGLTRELGSAAYSADGRFLAVAVHDVGLFAAPGQASASSSSIELWDVAAAKQVRQIPGHEGGTAKVVYSPDGKALVTSGYDNVIKVWDPASGREIRTLGRAAANILSLAVSPDGRLLASTHEDGATRLWDMGSGGQLATLVSLNDGGDWLAVTPDGLFDGSPAAWNKILWRFSENTFDVAPVEIFFNEYFYPDLLTDLLAGKRPRAAADIASRDRRQARIALDVSSAAPGAEVSSREIAVHLRVADAPAGARDLRLFRNGSLVKLWHGDVLQGRQAADFEVTVPVVAGANHFTAYAFNRDNIKSSDATAEVAGAASLKRRGVGYVLAVGVDEYENPDYNLRYAVADARSFAADVKAQMEKLDRFERVEVTVLTDRQATKGNILNGIAELSARVQPEDEVLVFAASHGAAARDRFYLIPSDLGYQGKRSELDEKAVDTILAHSISDQDLESAFETMNAARLLLVIDACNSGQALEAEEKRRGPMNAKGLAQLAYEKGMYVLTASQSYQAAQEVSELGHGLLTYALVTEGLERAAADVEPKDGRVVAREWLDYATGRVPRLQLEKIDEARKAGRRLRFNAGPRGDGAAGDDSTQHPRVFYRRELDDAAWIVASGFRQ